MSDEKIVRTPGTSALLWGLFNVASAAFIVFAFLASNGFSIVRAVARTGESWLGVFQWFEPVFAAAWLFAGVWYLSLPSAVVVTKGGLRGRSFVGTTALVPWDKIARVRVQGVMNSSILRAVVLMSSTGEILLRFETSLNHDPDLREALAAVAPEGHVLRRHFG
jgi:hypothetical protein